MPSRSGDSSAEQGRRQGVSSPSTQGTAAPATPPPGGRLRRLLLGAPLPTHREREERLSNPMALAILSSDALSSVAYATEEMLRVLLPVAGIAAVAMIAHAIGKLSAKAATPATGSSTRSISSVA